MILTKDNIELGMKVAYNKSFPTRFGTVVGLNPKFPEIFDIHWDEQEAGTNQVRVPISCWFYVVESSTIKQVNEKPCSTCQRMNDVGVSCWWCGNKS